MCIAQAAFMFVKDEKQASWLFDDRVCAGKQ
jgi:hypothetical protein